MEKDEERRAQQLASEMAATRRQQRNDQMASWDPSRVYQDTTGWRHRRLAENTKSEPKRTFILQPGGLAKASWRAGL